MHHVVLGEGQERHQPGRLRNNVGRHFGKAQVDDLDLVAALLVEADGGAHQCRNALDLVLVARLVDLLAALVAHVAAVEQHRDRDAVDAAALGDLGLGGAGDLVVDDFLGLAVLLAGGAIGFVLPLRRVRQLVAHADLTGVPAVGRPR